MLKLTRWTTAHRRLVVLGWIVLAAGVLKLFGVAMATAVFLDAIVIRSILMPAVLELPRRRTWAFPRSFDRRLPRFAIEPAVEPKAALERAA
jgi:RND superfamily putative drug exporter